MRSTLSPSISVLASATELLQVSDYLSWVKKLEATASLSWYIGQVLRTFADHLFYLRHVGFDAPWTDRDKSLQSILLLIQGVFAASRSHGMGKSAMPLLPYRNVHERIWDIISQPNNPSHSTPQSQNAKVYKIQAGSHLVSDNLTEVSIFWKN